MTEGPGRRDDRSRAGRRIVVTLLLAAVTAIAPMRGGEPRETDAEAIAIRALIARAENRTKARSAQARSRVGHRGGSLRDIVVARFAVCLVVRPAAGVARFHPRRIVTIPRGERYRLHAATRG